jgi:hypothetical protein
MNPAAPRWLPLLLGCLPVASAASASAPPDPPASPDAASAAVPAGEELRWPTDAGRCVTSGFCEFRPDHFHSGIDISTWGKVGYRCLAMDAGEIVRARVSCDGYGRALYLRLADGRTALYAHLSRFTGALEDTVRALQARTGSAYFDREFPPGTFPVGRGDLVAYSGQSGVGVPHLHVEIRDADERPLDPLRNGLHAEDTTPPWIDRVALTPTTPVSSVDGRSDTVILDVHPGDAPGTGHIPRTIPVEGDIGLSVEVDETTDACHFHLPPARLELREGDELRYAVDYRGFSFAETEQMDEQIDPRFSYAKVGRFHLLWRRPGNDLPFLENGADADSGRAGVLRAGTLPEEPLEIAADDRDPSVRGIVRQESGEEKGEEVRTVTLVAFDAAGNRGTATLSLSFAAPPGIRALSVQLDGARAASDEGPGLERAWEDTLEVHGAIGRGGRAIGGIDLEWSPDGGVTWFDGPRVQPEADDSFEARIALGDRVPGTGREGMIVRSRVLDVLGASGLARTAAPDTPSPPEMRPTGGEVVTMGGWTELRFPDTTAWQAASGGWESAHPGTPADSLVAVLVRPFGRGLRIVIPAREGSGGRRQWSGMGKEWAGIDPWGRPVPLTFDVPVTFAPGDSGRSVLAGDGHARVDLAPGSFRETCAVMLRVEPAPAPGTPELRALGPLYLVESGSVPPADPWTLTLHPAQDARRPEHAGIFVQDGDRFRYIGGEAVEGGGLSADSRSLLGTGLFEDVQAPALGPARLEMRYGRLSLLFRAEDGGAGIDCDGVEVLLDGEGIVHEVDDETGDVVAYPPARPSGATGRFELRAVDRCGNASRRVETMRFP